jgi:hypothetical protein
MVLRKPLVSVMLLVCFFFTGVSSASAWQLAHSEYNTVQSDCDGYKLEYYTNWVSVSFIELYALE